MNAHVEAFDAGAKAERALVVSWLRILAYRQPPILWFARRAMMAAARSIERGDHRGRPA